MSPDDSARYAAVVTEPESLDFEAAARVLAGLRGLAYEEARSAARAAWGLVVEDESEEEARRAAAALSAAGLPARALPQELVARLPEPVPVVRALRRAGGAALVEASGTGHPVHSAAVALLAAGLVKRTVARTVAGRGPGLGDRMLNVGLMITAGLPVGRAPAPPERVVEHFDLFGVLEVHLNAPSARLRVEAAEFDYSCLGARKSYETMANFRLLCGDLAGLFPRAARNRGFSAIAAQAAPGLGRYLSQADLDAESRWLLTVGALAR
ncbi:MAG: hypothetical protein PHF00_11715 [Elusimicrobia bacterium]|nr:hypothetical protein [Elusimicrobiota bacterium]